jgi:4'-phosphopantetheinyl transferase
MSTSELRISTRDLVQGFGERTVAAGYKCVPAIRWAGAHPPVRLLHREVHVWRAWLDLPMAQLERLERTLSERELVDALSLPTVRDRNRTIAARGIARMVLGGYLGVVPARLEFAANSLDRATPETDSHGLSFSFAHSGALALIAIGRGCDVGVDLHWTAEQQHDSGYAKPPDLRGRRGPGRTTFFSLWSHQEALAKALSHSIGADLRFKSANIGVRSKSMRDQAGSRRITIEGLRPAVGYVGALAVGGSDWKLTTYQWVEEDIEEALCATNL